MSKAKLKCKEPYPLNLFLSVDNGCLHTPIPVEDITQDKLDGLLHAVTLLLDRHQEILRLRFEERCTLAEIGEKFGISVERVRALIVTAQRKLREPSLYVFLKYGKQGKAESV